MNRENKRKQYQKGYYKTHACDDSFTCRVWRPSGRTGRRGQRPQESLSELPVQPACGR